MVPLYPPPPATKYLPFHLVGSATSKRIVDCGRLCMLPKTLQYSGTRPTAGTTVADVMVVSFNTILAKPPQSAADVRVGSSANSASTAAASTASVPPLPREARAPHRPCSRS